jgi:hypothetical protein
MTSASRANAEDDLDELLGSVLLHEVPGVMDGGVRLAGCTWHASLEYRFAEARDVLGVGERSHEGAVVAFETGPRLAQHRRGRIAVIERHEERELPSAGAVRLIGVGRVVGRSLPSAQPMTGLVQRAIATDHVGWPQLVALLRPLQPHT